MRFTYKTTIYNQQNLLPENDKNNNPIQNKITSLCYSPTNDFLAVSTINKVLLYDEKQVLVNTLLLIQINIIT